LALVSFVLVGCAAKTGNLIVGAEGERYAIAVQIAASADHSVALDSEGGVWVVGSNKYGQLGLGDEHSQTLFVKASSLSGKKIVTVAAGYGVTFAIDETGALWATGLNNFGQLGLGDTKNRAVFSRVTSLKNKKIVAVAAGVDHAIALDSEGKAYSTGLNNFGQLGLGDTKNRDRFASVTSLKDKKIVAVAAGYDHAFAIDDASGVWASGWNVHGQLGLGDNKRRTKFGLVGSLSGKKIAAIAAGDYHSVALGADGKLYTTGFSAHGQLGLGDKLRSESFVEVADLNGKKIVAIAAGGHYTIALEEGGAIWGAGLNGGGELGLGDLSDRYIFVKSGGVKNGAKITAIAAGSDHTIALLASGVVSVCGWNYADQMGLGDNRHADFVSQFENAIFSE
jgi:alpha-tubulin suppressor-like RCC1 family protein